MSLIFLLITILCVPCELLLNESFYKQSEIPEDGKLDFKGLAKKYNMSCEELEVITEDKYILTIFHISPRNEPKGLPVLLLYGFLDISETFIIRGKNSMAYNLSEHYDVWVGSIRGNKYGRRHETLNPDVDKVFWEYSFDENGFYDYAATIDYILNKTGKPKVDIIAHSQGNTGIFILCSTRPEYNDKINLFIAMGPISYMQNLRGLIVPLLKIEPEFIAGLIATGVVEILNENSTVRRFVRAVCSQRANYGLCFDEIAFTFLGFDREELEPAFAPIVIGHYLQGSSRQTLNHYQQLIYGKRFAKYDYGESVNLAKYNSVKPPLFDLSKVTCQVVLMVGKNDNLATVPDAKRLRDNLPKVVYFEMPREKFNHIDFLWGKNMQYNLFPYIHNMLDKYSVSD